jgi:hypothetical protein
VPLDVVVNSITSTDTYRQKSLTIATTAGRTVPARLFLPKNRKGKGPAVLYPNDAAVNWDGPIGKWDVPPVGRELVARGYACLLLPATDDPAAAVWTATRGLDLLDATPEVDINRIAVVGHAKGGLAGLLTAAFDQRVAAVVASCGFAELKSADGKTSVEMNELAATLAPRPTYLVAPAKDAFAVEKAKSAIANARTVFAFKQADRSLVAVHPEIGREFPEAERKKAYEWLDRILKP